MPHAAEIVIACSAPELSLARYRPTERCEVDWEQVRSLATRHMVIPLVHRHLGLLGGAAVPAALLAGLAADARRIARRNVTRTVELVRLAGVFDRDGIPCLPLKGPVLALKAYGNLAMRQFTDLDLLVPRADYARAALLLRGEGYEPLPKVRGPRVVREESFFAEERDTLLELHAALDHREEGFRTDAGELWESSERILVGGYPLRDLAVEQWLVLLAVHGARHLYYRLNWLATIAALLHRHPETDWERVAATAARWNARRCVRLTLGLAERFYRLPLAGAWSPLGRPGPPEELVAAWIARRLDEGCARPLLRAHPGVLLLQDRWVDRVAYGVWATAGLAARTVRRLGALAHRRNVESPRASST